MSARTPLREAVALTVAGRIHRLNNFLQAAVGAAELAAVSAPPDTEMAELTEAAAEAARRLVFESRTLFAIAELCWEPLAPTQLGPLVRAAVARALAGARTTVTFEGVDAVVLASPALLDEALGELASNARRAMSDGGALRVEGRPRCLAEGEHSPLPAGDYVEVRVADRGPGIPSDLAPALFEPLPRDGEPPMALGLAMVRAVVRQHRGAVWAEDAREGATFVVLLPVVAPSTGGP